MSATDDDDGGDGFEGAAFELLRELETGEAGDEAVDKLWARTRRLFGDLGAGLFGEHDHHVDLWPEGAGDDGDRGAFLWGRLKRANNKRFATHIGVFLSPGLCNLSIDLEKDLLDAGQSDESLEQFVGFCGSELPSLFDPATRPDLQVWTDSQNVVAAAQFGTVDFAAFMDANRDADHPWPKIGYISSAEQVQGFGNDWVGEYRARARPLVATYDAMIRSFGG